MEKIGLFWGSNTGNQEDAVKFLNDYLTEEGYNLELFNIAETEPKKMLDYDKLIIGCPTWHIGELQDDWYGIYQELDNIDMTGKMIAVFGLGDQYGYGDTFLDGMGILYKKMLERGATGKIGFWPTEGYEFDASEAIIDGEFCGLAIDQDCQSELTDERLEQWCQVLKQHLQKQAA